MNISNSCRSCLFRMHGFGQEIGPGWDRYPNLIEIVRSQARSIASHRPSECSLSFSTELGSGILTSTEPGAVFKLFLLDWTLWGENRTNNALLYHSIPSKSQRSDHWWSPIVSSSPAIANNAESAQADTAGPSWSCASASRSNQQGYLDCASNLNQRLPKSLAISSHDAEFTSILCHPSFG